MTNQRGSMWRTRWAAIGAAVAVTLGSGGLVVAQAASGNASSFVPVTPCRLLDTRAAAGIGGRTSPLGAKETYTVTVRGTNGNCTIPTDATAVSANVTTLDGTARSFLTIFPADANQPNASSNNWVSGQAATPNKVDAKLSADGRLKLYNDAGTVNVIIDVVGYYEPSGGATASGSSTGGVTGMDVVNAPATIINSGATTVASVSVNVPSSGLAFVAVEADLKNNFSSEPKVALCDISLGNTIGTTSRTVNVPATGNGHLSMTKTFVASPGTATFSLVCSEASSAGVSATTQITAIYSANTL